MIAKKKSKVSIGKILYFLIYALSGIIIGNLLASYQFGEDFGDFPLYLICFYFVIVISFLYNTIVHEAGHLIFGLISGYRFVSFRIFSFVWLKIDNKIRFKRYSVAGTAGQCLMTYDCPLDADYPVTLYNFGGSILNVISALVLYGLSLLVNKESIVGIYLLSFAVFGIAFALTNGIPLKLGLINNDGKNAIDLNKNQAARKAFLIQLKVYEQNAIGVRLRDMPEEWFYIPTDEEMQNPMSATIGVYTCNRLMDQHNFSAADELMLKYITEENGILELYKKLLMCDRIYCELIGQNRGDVIDEMFTDDFEAFLKTMKNFISVARTRYLYSLLSERNKENAEKHKKKFEKIAKKHPFVCDVDSEKELIYIATHKEHSNV